MAHSNSSFRARDSTEGRRSNSSGGSSSRGLREGLVLEGFTSEAGREANIASGRFTESQARSVPILDLDTGGFSGNFDREPSGSFRKGSSPISSSRSSSTPITADAIRPQTPIQLPTREIVPDLGNIVAARNQGLASASEGAFTSATNGTLTVAPPVVAEPVSKFQTFLQERLNADAIAKNELGTGADRFARLEKDAQIRQKERTFNDLTGQLNTIVAQRDANILRVEGQGRGIPEAIIGGQQAQINREAAIQALPVQAQLASAQQNLDMARSHVDKMFQIQSQDALANYQYKTNLNSSIFEFLTAEENRTVAINQRNEDRKFDREKTNIAMKNQWAMQAVEFGQSGLVGNIMSLDVNSETFTTDLARLQGQVRKPVVAKVASTPDVKNFGTNDAPIWKQFNPTTKIWENVSGLGGGETGTQETTQKAVDQLTFLQDTAASASKIANSGGLLRTPVGPSLINRAIGSALIGNTSFSQLQNKTDTLKTNVLALMTDPSIKKFFGPQMSNADVRLMSSTGSTLDPLTQSRKDYVAEIGRLDDLFNRMLTAVRNGQNAANANTLSPGFNIITAPDGRQIDIID